MTDLNTEIEGQPANIRAVARWLRQDLRPGFDALGNDVAAQRSAVAGDWQGEAGTAFSSRARTLVDATDDGMTTTGQVATLVGDLAEALQTAQSSMADVRQRASTGKLTVDGFWVRNPGSAPPSAGTLAADATPAEREAWEAADQAVRDHNAKVAVWNDCITLSNEALQKWLDALEAAGSAWKAHDTRYVLIGSNLLSAGVQLALIKKATPILAGGVDDMLARAQQLRDHADALKSPDGTVLDRQRFYDLLDEADRLDADHPAARRALSNWELPKGLTRGLWVIDVAAAGYGIYSDWEDEGPAQATTSNAVPAVASILAAAGTGAYVGGVVGSFVPIPGVGTAAGVVVGATVGIVVGAFTSGAIDSLFDSGADTLGDWGGAVMDGLDEVGDTFGSVAEGVGDVFDSIF